MMHALLNSLAIWHNPVFHRFRRSQLRFRSSLFWLLATLIITTFVIALTHIVQTSGYVALPVEQAARNQWLPLLIIQGLILLIKGTGKTSAGLIQDKIEQTLDYQRLTPVKPLRNIVGYLFGLPILEYAMFALTLPHLAFVVIVGNIPLTSVLSVYVAFFTCAIFYHTTAIAVAMVMKRWVLGYLLSIFSVAALNLVIAPLGSQLGIKFLQYLSVYPIFGQEVLPLMGGGGPNLLRFADQVPFFEWSLSPFIFTLLLQCGLIATFTTMVIRRWQKASKHSLSKFYSLGILVAFITLFAGNLWPVITGDSLPFPIFGTQSLSAISNEIAVFLPLIYAGAIWLLCIFLFSNTVPNHHAYIRGVRRAIKLGRKRALPWEDDSANIPFMCLFIAIAVAGFAFIAGEMNQAGFNNTIEAGEHFTRWRLPLALTLVLLSTLLMLQVLQNRGSVLVGLLVWTLPLLIMIVSIAANEGLTTAFAMIASISPIAFLIMTGLLHIDMVVQMGPNEDFNAVNIGAQTGLALITLQIAILSWRWLQLRTRLH